MSEVAELLRWATGRLAAAGVPSPRHDAEALLRHVSGLSRTRLVTARGAAPYADEYAALVERRATREPLQHLTGRAGFRRLELAVGPGVFVPRPETELLVDAVLAALPPGGMVVDLCAGSGAIALAVADERPDAVVYAVEREPAAYGWLTRNAAGSGVRCVCADAADALPELDGRVDVVVSNPPYIPLGASPIDPEVARYDPPAALWAGSDGLEVIRAVATRAARLLRPGGRLVVEHADTQGQTVPDLLRGEGWTDVEDHPDLTGRRRFATGSRP